MNKAFIFDMDGVLIDTELTWVREGGDEFVIDLVGKKVFERIGTTIGMSVDQLYDAAALSGFSMEKHEYYRLFDEYMGSIHAKSNLTEGIELLAGELGRLGFRLGLVSSSRQNWIDKVLPRLPFREKLEHVVSVNDRRDLRAKPHPDGYLEAIRVLGARPEQTIILEDSNTGIKAAKASGAFTIGFRKNLVHGYEQKGADVYADDIHEVIRIAAGFKQA